MMTPARLNRSTGIARAWHRFGRVVCPLVAPRGRFGLTGRPLSLGDVFAAGAPGLLGAEWSAQPAQPRPLTSRHLRLADLPFPSYRKPQARAGRDGQGVLMP
jgi:hypothetical protein